MVRFSAKTDTVVCPARIVRTTYVPRIASTPTRSGRNAATRLPKTITSAMNTRGAVSISDRCRSFSARWLIWASTGDAPLIATWSGPWVPT